MEPTYETVGALFTYFVSSKCPAMPQHLANLSMKNFLKNFMSTGFAVPPPKAQKLVLILVIITQHAVPFTIIIMKLI